ncbi:MAG TPA: 2-oxoacid:acceptor oxidoreductase subunit alpha [Symbiobacteriaceae bacterium]|jgi:2-oxoglutarate ferredoxin oxidoreductase subunit alpha
MATVAAPPRTKVLMQGNEAIVQGALAAGLRFYAGYPITPSTEIAELCAENLPKVGGRFLQMEDEIASMAAVVGGALAGRKAMTATSGPGFSLKQELIGYAAQSDVPCVIVNVQRMGPSTGVPTAPAQGDIYQARYGSHGDYAIIALSPNSVNEAFYTTIKAFNLAEKYRTPVILLTDEIVGHLRETVALPDPSTLEIVDRKLPTDPPGVHKAYKPEANGVPVVPNMGMGYRFHTTGLIHMTDGFPTTNPKLVQAEVERLSNKINSHLDDIYQYETTSLEDADVVIFAYGGTSRSAMAALKQARAKGLKVGMYRPITIWPFHDEKVRAALAGKKAVIVPELNLGQLSREVERVSGGDTKLVKVNKVSGEILTPQDILTAIEGVY